MVSKKVGLNSHPYHFYVRFAWNAHIGHYCVETSGKKLPMSVWSLAKIVHRLGRSGPGDLWVYEVRGVKCWLRRRSAYDAKAWYPEGDPDTVLFAYKL